MTEPTSEFLHRLELRRERRAAAAAARAAMEECRKHGLIARHKAKLARLAERTATTTEPEETTTTTEPNEPNNDAA
jgi:hypothetical protein